MLQFSNYIAVNTIPTPPQHDLYQHTEAWPMLANDNFYCCTSDAAKHMVHHWTTVNQDTIVLTDKDILLAHAKLNHNHLTDPVSILDALKFWRKFGIRNHRIHSFVSAGEAKADTFRAVIYLFGAAYVGLDLPNFALPRTPDQVSAIKWDISPSISPQDAAPRESNGHCVAAIGYDKNSVYIVSWSTLKTMSWNFFLRYTDEA